MTDRFLLPQKNVRMASDGERDCFCGFNPSYDYYYSSKFEPTEKSISNARNSLFLQLNKIDFDNYVHPQNRLIRNGKNEKENIIYIDSVPVHFYAQRKVSSISLNPENQKDIIILFDPDRIIHRYKVYIEKSKELNSK